MNIEYKAITVIQVPVYQQCSSQTILTFIGFLGGSVDIWEGMLKNPDALKFLTIFRNLTS